MTTSNTPPEIAAAIEGFKRALKDVEGRDVDPTTAPWDEIEKGVIKLLGGPFHPGHPDHQTIAFMVGASLAARLERDHGAFWFQNREAPAGAALGFPEAIVTLSPVQAAVEALQRAKLPMLDDVGRDIGNVLARAKFGAGGGGGVPAGQRLGPGDYQGLFDAGFVQFLALDLEKAKPAWENTPDAVAREIDDAIGRAPDKLPKDVREQIRQQIVGQLRRLDAQKPLSEQAPRAPRLLELCATLYGQVGGTGFAPEELWQDVLLPLLHVGAPETFPPVDEEEKAALAQGMDPLLLFVDVVPYKTPAADEDGLLGVFPARTLAPIHGSFAPAAPLRLVRVDVAPIKALVDAFDPVATRRAITRFTAHVTGAEPSGESDGRSLTDIAIALLTDLKRVVEEAGKGAAFCVRRSTEIEAASEPALHLVRQAMSAPRIVLV